MLKGFEARRAERLAHEERSQEEQADEPEYFGMHISELMARDSPPTSENRLEVLPADAWSPDVFEAGIKELQRRASLSGTVLRAGEALPNLTPETEFKYRGSYLECEERARDGEELLVAVVAEGVHVIGFGIARLEPAAATTVETIDVDESSSRFAGLEVALSIGGEEFTVGVAHLVVLLFLDQIEGTMEVDATNESSRYVFKSLGFTQVPGEEDNPCILWRPAPAS